MLEKLRFEIYLLDCLFPHIPLRTSGLCNASPIYIGLVFSSVFSDMLHAEVVSIQFPLQLATRIKAFFSINLDPQNVCPCFSLRVNNG